MHSLHLSDVNRVHDLATSRGHGIGDGGDGGVDGGGGCVGRVVGPPHYSLLRCAGAGGTYCDVRARRSGGRFGDSGDGGLGHAEDG